MTTTTPALIDAAELVALIDGYAKLQAAHGDAARLAHEAPDDMALGQSAVDLETESTEIRYALGEALVWLCDNDPETTPEQMKALFEVIDGYASGLWHTAWHAALDGAATGGALDEYRRREAEPLRQVWEPAARALVERRDARNATAS